MQTGNLVPNGGLLGLLSNSMPVNNSLGMQSTTPASATPTMTTGSASNTGLTSASPTPLISSVNPNADAILKAHSTTVKALNVAPSSATTGYSLGYGTEGNAQTSDLGSAQINAATGAGTPNSLTLAQLAAQQNLIPDPNNPGQYIPASPYSTNGTTPGTLGTGSPSSTAANQTPSGLLGNMIGQSQTNVQNVQAQFQPIIDYNTGILNNIQAEESAISGGSFQGSASDYAGRLGQLESLKQSAQANINNAQTNIQNAINSGQSAFSTGLTAATTGANVTPPAGEVTTNALTGAQYSNPALAPVGTQAFYSPQPGGTPTGTGGTQPATAGQAQQYTIQSGDTFNAIAAKYGTTAAALEAANPGMTPTDLQIGANMVIPAQGAGTNTPFTGGEAQAQAGLGAQYVQNNATILAAQGIQQKIGSDITSNNLNHYQLNVANIATQWLNGQLSSATYGNLANDLTDYAGTIAPLIGMLGTQTDAKSFVAQQMTAGSASGQTLTQILDNLNSLLLNKNEATAQAGQGAAGQGATPPGQNTNTSAGGAGTQQVGTLGTYTMVNGQWVVA